MLGPDLPVYFASVGLHDVNYRGKGLCKVCLGRVFTIYKTKLDVSFVQTFVKTTAYVWTCLTKQIASYRVLYDHVERILHFHLAL